MASDLDHAVAACRTFGDALGRLAACLRIGSGGGLSQHEAACLEEDVRRLAASASSLIPRLSDASQKMQMTSHASEGLAGGVELQEPPQLGNMAVREEGQPAGDDTAVGTQEIDILLKQLDVVNGTIRLFDEMIAKQSLTPGSLLITPGTVEPEVVGSLRPEAVPQVPAIAEPLSPQHIAEPPSLQDKDKRNDQLVACPPACPEVAVVDSIQVVEISPVLGSPTMGESKLHQHGKVNSPDAETMPANILLPKQLDEEALGQEGARLADAEDTSQIASFLLATAPAIPPAAGPTVVQAVKSPAVPPQVQTEDPPCPKPAMEPKAAKEIQDILVPVPQPPAVVQPSSSFQPLAPSQRTLASHGKVRDNIFAEPLIPAAKRRRITSGSALQARAVEMLPPDGDTIEPFSQDVVAPSEVVLQELMIDAIEPCTATQGPQSSVMAPPLVRDGKPQDQAALPPPQDSQHGDSQPVEKASAHAKPTQPGVIKDDIMGDENKPPVVSATLAREAAPNILDVGTDDEDSANEGRGREIISQAMPQKPSAGKPEEAEAEKRVEMPSHSVMKVLFTGLAKQDVFRYKRCINRLGGIVVSSVPPPGENAADVRVVACCKAPQRGSKRPSLAASRTLKYLDAVLSGAWIVSAEWILDSNSADCWLPEADYELAGDSCAVGGPAQGRHHGHQLFKGLRMYFLGLDAQATCVTRSVSVGPGNRQEFGPSAVELQRLALRGGAEVLHQIEGVPDSASDPPCLSDAARAASDAPPRRRRKKSREPLRPVWWRQPLAILPCRTMVKENDQHALSQHGWTLVPYGWMLDCISSGAILPPDASMWRQTEACSSKSHAKGLRA
mmetsp:Transcript_2630/g.6784  ORF Transcript_2630/g.6784 Transcript_2630/m.6784 type:complete len:842 (+) Transcript_2630:73-2598(+)